MSGSSKRRHSKWEHIDSDAFPENFNDRAPPRRPREPISPGRGSRRHDIRNKESTMTWDREGNSSRMSPELDERRARHSSRSPRNGWGRSHRISKSRSRSRSPVPNFRRDPAANDRNRSRSGASAQICRDFAGGRCRRGNSCHFLHQEAQVYDSRRQECSSPDDWEGRRRRIGGSRYSPDDNKDNAIRTEKSSLICNDFLKGRCRRADCRYVHHDAADDVFEKGPVDDVYRNRDHEPRSRDSYPDLDRRSRDSYPDLDRRSRDSYPDLDRRSRDSYPDIDRKRRETYPDRNHEFEPSKRGATICKFFAAGNCRNGTRCRFSHQVQQNFSPDRRSVDDRHGPDHKLEGSQGWDGPRWSDVTTVSTVPDMQGWGDEKIDNKEVNTVRTQGASRGSRWSDVTTVSTVPDMTGWEQDRMEKKEVSTAMTHCVGMDPDHKDEGDRVWDGPSWNDVAAMASHVPVVHGWGEMEDDVTEVAKEVTGARPGDDSWSRNMLDINQTWDTPATIDKPQIQENKQPLQWKMEPVVSGMGFSVSRGIENFSGDMAMSPRAIKEQGVNSSTSQTPSISNIAFPVVQQNAAGEAFSDKHYQAGFQEQKSFDDPYSEQNHSREDNNTVLYPGERIEKVGVHDGSCTIQNQPIHVSQGQGIFQPNQSVNVHPVSNVNPPLGQSQFSLPSHPSHGEMLQFNNPSFLDNKVADGSHVVSFASSALAPGPATAPGTVSNVQLAQLSSALAPGPATAPGTVSNVQLAQLSHLTASLTQLLESRQQQSQFSSAVTPQSMSNLPELTSVPSVSAVIQPSQAPEVLNQYDPVYTSSEAKMPNLGNNLLPSVQHKSSNNETQHDDSRVNRQEPLASSKDDENGRKSAEANVKAPENGPSHDAGADDGAEDSKKPKDMKGIRPFKNALVEFVKELLKPAWKEGQVDKEAYKTIVKKVVDKVVETLGPQIPQTKEKIDMYLSCSKPKIGKLVQAYVGKHQKS